MSESTVIPVTSAATSGLETSNMDNMANIVYSRDGPCVGDSSNLCSKCISVANLAYLQQQQPMSVTLETPITVPATIRISNTNSIYNISSSCRDPHEACSCSNFISATNVIGFQTDSQQHLADIPVTSVASETTPVATALSHHNCNICGKSCGSLETYICDSKNICEICRSLSNSASLQQHLSDIPVTSVASETTTVATALSNYNCNICGRSCGSLETSVCDSNKICETCRSLTNSASLQQHLSDIPVTSVASETTGRSCGFLETSSYDSNNICETYRALTNSASLQHLSDIPVASETTPVATALNHHNCNICGRSCGSLETSICDFNNICETCCSLIKSASLQQNLSDKPVTSVASEPAPVATPLSHHNCHKCGRSFGSLETSFRNSNNICEMCRSLTNSGSLQQPLPVTSTTSAECSVKPLVASVSLYSDINKFSDTISGSQQIFTSDLGSTCNLFRSLATSAEFVQNLPAIPSASATAEENQ